MNPWYGIVVSYVVYLSPLVCGGNVQPLNGNVLTGTLDEDLLFEWKITVSSDEFIDNFKVYSQNNTKIIQSNPPLMTQQGKYMYGQRLIPSYDKATSTFKLLFKKLAFIDVSHEFKLTCVLAKKKDFDDLSSKSAIIGIYDVEGGPNLCGGTNITVNGPVEEGQRLWVYQDVCGKPKPEVKWKLDTEKKYKNSTNYMLVNNVTQLYRHIYGTEELSRKHCWSTIMFKAISKTGSVTGHDMVNVIFTPAKVSGVSFYRHGNCTHVKWDQEDTGKCKVTYHLQFGSGNVMKTLDTKFEDCTNPEVMVADVMKLWGTHGSKEADHVTINITTAPPPTIMTTIHPAEEREGDDDNMSLVIGVVVGILVFIIVIVIIGVCYLKHKSHKSSDDHDGGMLMHDPSTENAYGPTPSSTSQRAPNVNSDHPIYSELGPCGGRTGPRPKPAESDYAEIKVDAMGYPVDGALVDLSHGQYASIDDSILSPDDNDDGIV